MADGEAAKLPTNEGLLRATLDLAQTQILAQAADETSLDGRTIGVLAFNAALLAADVAARELLGPAWWTPLIPVLVASVIGGWSVASKEPYFGPLALDLYTNYRTYDPGVARETVLASLNAAFGVNAARISGKKSRLRWALGILAAGLVASALVIYLNPPTKVGSHESTDGKTKATASTGPHHAACTVAAPTSGSERSSRIGVNGCPAGHPLVEVAATIEGGEHGPLFQLAEEIEGT